MPDRKPVEPSRAIDSQPVLGDNDRPRLTVFVSSTTRDLQDLRNELFERLIREGHTPWMCEQPSTWPAPQYRDRLRNCRENAESADYFVMLLDREAGQPCGAEADGRPLTFTQAEYRARLAKRGVDQLVVFVRERTAIEAGMWKLAREQLASAPRPEYARPELLDFYITIDDEQEWLVPFRDVNELWACLRPRLGDAMPLDAIQRPGCDGIEAEQREAVSRTRSAPRHRPPSYLPVAAHARAAASLDADDFAAAVAGAALVADGGPTAFWFVSSLRSSLWLRPLTHPLRALAREGDPWLQQAIGRYLCKVAEVSPDLVMQSSVVAALWESGTVWGRAKALQVVQAAGAWEDERTLALLDSLGPDDKETMERTAHALSEHVAGHAESAPSALGWLAKWVPTCVSGPAPRGIYAIERSLHAVIQAAPEAALDAAETILDAYLGTTDPAEAQHGLLYPLSISPDTDSPLIQVRRLLADGLTEPESHAEALAILDGLATSEDATRRLTAMDAMKNAGSTEACRKIILKSIENPRNYVWPHLEWVYHLVNYVFPRAAPRERQRLRSAIAGLPDESEQERGRGAIKWYALAAIPDRYRTAEIRAAMRRLKEANPQLSEPSREPRCPGQQMAFRPMAEEPLGWDWDELMAEPARLVSRVTEIATQHPHGPYSVGQELGQALAQTPARIPAVLKAIASADPPVSADLVGAATRSLGQAESIDGMTLLLVARTLEPIANTQTRQALSGAIARRWQALPKRTQAEAAALLCEWARPEIEPDPATSEYGTGTDDPVDAGLNSGRGGIAVAMLDVLPFATGRTQAALRKAILRLAADPAVRVRAVVLAWLGNTVGAADPQWLVECAKLCVCGFHPAVLAEAHRVLRDLGPADISEFGLSLVRVMLGSGDKAAQAGGFLATFWHLWSGAEGPDVIVEDIIAGDCTPAKEEAARVFAVNLLADDDGARAKAAAGAAQLLQDKSAEVRRAVVAHLPPAGQVDLSPAAQTIELAAGDSDREVLGALWMHVHADQPEADRRNATVIAKVIRRILSNGDETTQREFIVLHDYHIVGVYGLLKDSGEEDLALRLLDAACYHRLAQAGPLLDELDSGAACLKQDE